MKKILIIWAAVFIFIFTARAQDENQEQEETVSGHLKTERIDKAWRKTPALTNTIKEPYVYNGYGKDSTQGLVRLFVGYLGNNKITMCITQMPDVIQSEEVSLQLRVNGKYIYVTHKAPCLDYEKPKYILKKIIIRAYSGIYPSHKYFYIIIEPDGSAYYTTELVNDDVWAKELTKGDT